MKLGLLPLLGLANLLACAAAPQRVTTGEKQPSPPVAGGARPGAQVRAPARERRHAEDDEMQVSGTTGQLDQEQIAAGFRTGRAEIDACYRAAASRFAFLGGTLQIKVKVSESGATREVRIVQPLGSFEVEECALRAVGKIKFEAPSGGETDFEYPIRFAGKPPGIEWSNADVAAVFTGHRAQLSQCMGPKSRASLPAGTRVTFFVAPGGVVKSAGVGADELLPEALRRCVADRVASWKFQDPLGRIARATYQF